MFNKFLFNRSQDPLLLEKRLVFGFFRFTRKEKSEECPISQSLKLAHFLSLPSRLKNQNIEGVFDQAVSNFKIKYNEEYWQNNWENEIYLYIDAIKNALTQDNEKDQFIDLFIRKIIPKKWLSNNQDTLFENINQFYPAFKLTQLNKKSLMLLTSISKDTFEAIIQCLHDEIAKNPENPDLAFLSIRKIFHDHILSIAAKEESMDRSVDDFLISSDGKIVQRLLGDYLAQNHILKPEQKSNFMETLFEPLYDSYDFDELERFPEFEKEKPSVFRNHYSLGVEIALEYYINDKYLIFEIAEISKIKEMLNNKSFSPNELSDFEKGLRSGFRQNNASEEEFSDAYAQLVNLLKKN